MEAEKILECPIHLSERDLRTILHSIRDDIVAAACAGTCGWEWELLLIEERMLQQQIETGARPQGDCNGES